MASGIYAQVSLSAGVDSTVYTTIPTLAVYNIRMVNNTASSITVGLAICATATPAANEYIEADGTTIPAYGIIENQGIPIQSGKLIVAYASAAGVNVNVWGVE